MKDAVNLSIFRYSKIKTVKRVFGGGGGLFSVGLELELSQGSNEGERQIFADSRWVKGQAKKGYPMPGANGGE